jgi:hypothetical protein
MFDDLSTDEKWSTALGVVFFIGLIWAFTCDRIEEWKWRRWRR